jgi:hypothetical protein
MRHIPALRKALPPPFPARSIVYMWIRDEDKPALVVVEGVPRLWLWLRIDVLDNRGLIDTAPRLRFTAALNVGRLAHRRR